MVTQFDHSEWSEWSPKSQMGTQWDGHPTCEYPGSDVHRSLLGHHSELWVTIRNWVTIRITPAQKARINIRVVALRVGHLLRDKWTALSGPPSRHKWPKLSHPIMNGGLSGCDHGSVTRSFGADFEA